MYTEGFEQWFKINKNLTAPVGELNRAGADLYRRYAQESLELASENFARFADQLKRLSNVKRPEDLINLQKDCLNEDITAALENTQKLIHLTVENAEECVKLCGSIRDTTIKTVDKEREREKEREKEKHGK